MRIAVISDVHGNLLALEAVLEHISGQAPDMVVNLGDLAAGPMEPLGAVERLIEADLPTVRGNHERWMAPGSGQSDAVDSFAAERLPVRLLSWLENLPATLSIGEDVFMCHGTPTSDTEPWIDNWFDGRTVTLPAEREVTALADGLDFPVLLCGHTHMPRAVRLRDGRLLVNPGSVGLQIYHGSPDARYALVDRRDGRWSATLVAVPYDHEGAARQAEDNGFPQWRQALTTGWVGPQGLFEVLVPK